MCEANIQLPDVMLVKATAHLLAGQLRESHKECPTGLTIKAMAQTVILINVEQVGVRLFVKIVNELDPPMDVLSVTITKLARF